MMHHALYDRPVPTFATYATALCSVRKAMLNDEILQQSIPDNRSKPREFQGHRLKIKDTGPDFPILYHCEIGQKACAHDNS